MKAYITSYPPLSQVTETINGQVHFTVLLDVDEIKRTLPWEVGVWYSCRDDWKDAFLQLKSKTSVDYHSGQYRIDASQCRLCFRGMISIDTVTTFTIKFRSAPTQPWKWVKDRQGQLDGVIQLKFPGNAALEVENLDRIVGSLNPDLNVKKVRSQTRNTSLWSITTSVDAAEGDNSTFSEAKFGNPWFGDSLRWFGLIRRGPPWLEPRQGKSHFDLNGEAIVCSFLERLSGRHLVLLAISGVNDVMTLLTSDSKGNVVLKPLNVELDSNDSDKPQFARLVVALGNDFESANAAAMYHARAIVHGDEGVVGQEKKSFQIKKDETVPQWNESWFDGLAYCTWNALGQNLTDQKVLKAVNTLTASNIKITTLIIDDNWQSLDRPGRWQTSRGWTEFEADRDTFPKGLKHTVSAIRDQNPHIQHVAVWHALWGYWGALSPTGKIAKSYKTVKAARADRGGGEEVTVVGKEDVSKMYEDFYKFLSDSGIDAVKTDAQFMFDTLESAKDRRDLFTAYLDAWSISSLRNFSTKAISCMSQTPQIIFHSLLPRNKPAIPMRNSDDFFPNNPDSHPWHVFTNACNNLLSQHLNVIPDWDMFQTVHDYSGFHAAARCVSGGPIYITDIPGQHNMSLIHEMTAETTRGKTVILRPSCVGRNIDPYISNDDPALLKVGTFNGSTYSGTPILGIFNVSPRPMTELIPLSRFPGVQEAQLYIVSFHTTGRMTKPMQVVSPSSLLAIDLPVRGYEICTAYALRGFLTSDDETTWIASLGLRRKMTGAAAILDTTLTMDATKKITVSTTLKALGVLGLYISTLPTLSVQKSFIVFIQGKVIPVHTVKKSEIDDRVLEIDVETAWKEMGLDAGWSNEVQVVVCLNPS